MTVSNKVIVEYLKSVDCAIRLEKDGLTVHIKDPKDEITKELINTSPSIVQIYYKELDSKKKELQEFQILFGSNSKRLQTLYSTSEQFSEFEQLRESLIRTRLCLEKEVEDHRTRIDQLKDDIDRLRQSLISFQKWMSSPKCTDMNVLGSFPSSGFTKVAPSFEDTDESHNSDQDSKRHISNLVSSESLIAAEKSQSLVFAPIGTIENPFPDQNGKPFEHHTNTAMLKELQKQSFKIAKEYNTIRKEQNSKSSKHSSCPIPESSCHKKHVFQEGSNTQPMNHFEPSMTIDPSLISKSSNQPSNQDSSSNVLYSHLHLPPRFPTPFSSSHSSNHLSNPHATAKTLLQSPHSFLSYYPVSQTQPIRPAPHVLPSQQKIAPIPKLSRTPVHSAAPPRGGNRLKLDERETYRISSQHPRLKNSRNSREVGAGAHTFAPIAAPTVATNSAEPVAATAAFDSASTAPPSNKRRKPNGRHSVADGWATSFAATPMVGVSVGLGVDGQQLKDRKQGIETSVVTSGETGSRAAENVALMETARREKRRSWTPLGEPPKDE